MAVTTKHLLVTLKDDYVSRSKAVVAALKKAGLTHVEAMASIGIVSGRAPAARVDAIRKVAGVLAVEESEWTQLAPPDAPVQ